MTNSSLGIIGRRAANQQRGNVLTYLALRYYLDNSAARSDEWAMRVACGSVLRRVSPAYFAVQNFKERAANGRVGYRNVMLPDAAEALAETTLLSSCARSTAFQAPPRVYSYLLTTPEDEQGAFAPFMDGLRRRQQQIAGACNSARSAVVRYLDIRGFYPSVEKGLAHTAWATACERDRKFSAAARALGERLLDGYYTSQPEGVNGLLLGPMFSHLLAGEVLRPLDEWGATLQDVEYFRYVDDFTLLGDRAKVDRATDELTNRLDAIGLALHPTDSPKCLTVSAEHWLEHASDYTKDRSETEWMRLVLAIKLLLTTAPEQREPLQELLDGQQFGIPLRNYDALARDRNFTLKLLQLTTRWLHSRTGRLRRPESILSLALALRVRFLSEILSLVGDYENADAFRRKQVVSMLRYRASRLLYLGDPDTLRVAAAALAEVSELSLHVSIIGAVVGRTATIAAELGVNGAQAAAQVLRARGVNTLTGQFGSSETALSARAVFAIHGITANETLTAPPHELLEFAVSGSSPALMLSSNRFIQEISSLHGPTNSSRHLEILETALHQDEDTEFYALGLLAGSASG